MRCAGKLRQSQDVPVPIIHLPRFMHAELLFHCQCASPICSLAQTTSNPYSRYRANAAQNIPGATSKSADTTNSGGAQVCLLHTNKLLSSSLKIRLVEFEHGAQEALGRYLQAYEVQSQAQLSQSPSSLLHLGSSSTWQGNEGFRGTS
jgi:hypothetical protein